jgi:hypothetical protein
MFDFMSPQAMNFMNQMGQQQEDSVVQPQANGQNDAIVSALRGGGPRHSEFSATMNILKPNVGKAMGMGQQAKGAFGGGGNSIFSGSPLAGQGVGAPSAAGAGDIAGGLSVGQGALASGGGVAAPVAGGALAAEAAGAGAAAAGAGAAGAGAAGAAGAGAAGAAGAGAAGTAAAGGALAAGGAVFPPLALLALALRAKNS